VLARVAGSDSSGSLDAATALLAGELEDLDTDPPALIAVLAALPYPSKTWARAGVALCGRIVASLDSDADPAMRAYWLASLGARRWQADRRAEAVSCTEQAVALRRELVAVDTDRHLASLALSLSKLGHQLAGLGRTAAAINAIEEAATMYRAVAVVSPGRYLPGLASALARLGRCYARAGQDTKATQASDEAGLIRRRLAAASQRL
jgi:tetratricopeptide (TPR) repeat protein